MLPLSQTSPAKGLSNEELRLVAPRLKHAEGWIEARRISRETLEPLEATWPVDALTKVAYRRRVETDQHNRQSDLGYGFDILCQRSGAFVGVVNLSNVRRNIQQSCTIGYWINDRFSGRGLMTAAVGMACDYAFSQLELHRIEAGHVPENTRSGRVLRRCGFKEVGFAESYLKIAGQWRDHILYALVNPDEPS